MAPETVSPRPKSFLPTRKWWAMVAGGMASIVASWVVTEGFDDVERGMGATLLVAAVSAYFRSNVDTPGGVPPKNLRSSWSSHLKDDRG